MSQIKLLEKEQQLIPPLEKLRLAPLSAQSIWDYNAPPNHSAVPTHAKHSNSSTARPYSNSPTAYSTVAAATNTTTTTTTTTNNDIQAVDTKKTANTPSSVNASSTIWLAILPTGDYSLHEWAADLLHAVFSILSKNSANWKETTRKTTT